MRLISLVLVFLVLSTTRVQAPGDLHSYGMVNEYEDAFTRVLVDVLTEDGLVHYDRLATHPEWPAVVRGVELFDFSSAQSDAEKLAFWINAYNVHMLNLVAERPGRDNVLGLDLGTVFFKNPVKVAGQQLTLDQIEHGILREQEAAFSRLRPSEFDPRIHVALNCAALACPRLWPEAYRVGELDDQLDRSMRNFVNSPKHFRMEGDTFKATKLLDWFAPDFDRAGMPAGDWLLSYMDPERPDYAAIRSRLEGRVAEEIEADFEYDWTVNRAD